MGARQYTIARDIQFKSGEVAVEIGAERGEGSTEYLRQTVPKLYSIDVMPTIEGVIKAKGEDWLTDFPKGEKIKFAYLDNFDYIPPGYENQGWIHAQQRDYATIGLEMNNGNSMATHLAQAKLVEANAAPFCEILIDDTFMENGSYSGKGGTAVPWLLDNGYELINEIAPTFTGGYAHLKRKC